MRFHEWLHPRRQLMLALVAVAIVSAGALGWLGWLLIQQDAALARQQETDRLQQRAETVAAALRASLADLPRLAAASTTASSVRIGVLDAVLSARGVIVRGDTHVLWVPEESSPREAPAADLGVGEVQEFSGDLLGALKAYTRVTRNRPREATALARVARVERKLQQSAAALATYDRLDALAATTVDGLPASLVARVGRASVHADGGDVAANASWTTTSSRSGGRSEADPTQPKHLVNIRGLGYRFDM